MSNQRGKSQITIFIIAAIIIVGLIVGSFYVSNKSPITLDKATPQKAIANIVSERDKCLEALTIEALDLYGLNQDKISFHLNSGFLNCILPIITPYKNQFEISYTVTKLEAVVTNDEIRINLNMPLQVEKDDQIEKTEGKQWIHLRTISANVNSDSNCILTEDVALISFDKKFDMHLSKGTKATKADGSCLKEITLRMEDPEIAYGGREKSYTSIAYIPGPLGAQFNGKVVLSQKYGVKDYEDYVQSSRAANSYIVPEGWIKLQYYDAGSKNFYVYVGDTQYSYNPYDNKKVVSVNVDQFYDGTIVSSSDCIAKKAVVIESPDKRMRVSLPTNVKITDSYDRCVNKIIVVNLTRSSASTFGAGDYGFLPLGTQFSPSIELIYRYTPLEASDSSFLYGRYNWQGLVNGTWTQPDPTQMASKNISTRRESDLRLAFLDNGIFNPYPTQIDTTNKEIIGLVNKFPGTSPAPEASSITGNSIGDLIGDVITAHGDPAGNFWSKGESIGDSGGATNRIATKTNCEDAAYGRWRDVASSRGSNPGTFKFTLTKEYSCAHTAIVNYEVTSEGNSAIADPAGLPKTYYPNELGGEHSFSITVTDDNIDGEASADAYIEIWGGGLTTSESSFEELTDGEYCWYYPTANKCGGEWSESFCIATYTGLELEGCLACVRMYQTGGDGGNTLNYCTHAVIGEGGTTVAYQAATCTANTGGYKSSASIVGYMVGDWWKINPTELATALYNNGLSYTYVELLSDPYNSVTKPELQLPKFKTYVEAMRAKNITTIVNLVHGKLNDGEGNYICRDAFGEAYFNNLLNYVNNIIGSDKIIIGPNHEWVSGCPERRANEINTLLSYNTNSEKMFYMIAKGPRHYMAVHPAPDEGIPSGALNVMDGGEVLKMTSTVNSDGSVSAVPDKLEAYAKSVLACGSGIIYYGYAQSFIDFGAIQALGRAKASLL